MSRVGLGGRGLGMLYSHTGAYCVAAVTCTPWPWDVGFPPRPTSHASPGTTLGVGKPGREICRGPACMGGTDLQKAAMLGNISEASFSSS